MITEIDIKTFLSTDLPLIDVRSPMEFRHGHIPGAVNIPLFSDEERAHVGTVYVRQSREKAIEIGMKYVQPKLDAFIEQSERVSPKREVAVHCWRGGMRSRAFAQHLSDHNFEHVFLIKGGYKSYRRHVLGTFDISFDLQMVGGYTGSGKTYIIGELQKMGHQAVDLEFLAHHKGSAFGSVGDGSQPTVEQFENDLFDAWRKLDYSKPIWLEDESHNIGGVNIPMNLFDQMRSSSLYFLDIPKEERAKHLAVEYAEADPEMLSEGIRKISKRLDGLKIKEAHDYLLKKNYYEVALIALHHYDKTYQKGMRFRNPEKVSIIPGTSTNANENALKVLKIYEEHEQYKTHSI